MEAGDQPLFRKPIKTRIEELAVLTGGGSLTREMFINKTAELLGELTVDMRKGKTSPGESAATAVDLAAAAKPGCPHVAEAVIRAHNSARERGLMEGL